MVKDIRYVGQTGRRRDRTWAHAGDLEGMRRSQNTMGYQVQTLTLSDGIVTRMSRNLMNRKLSFDFLKNTTYHYNVC
jgi:hypothetical protein